MKRLSLSLSIALMGLGCDAIDTPLVIRGIAPSVQGAGGCGFMPDQARRFGVVLDTEISYKLHLPFDVENTLQEVLFDYATMTSINQLQIRAPNDVTPLRFELRWECDNNGFTSDLGALVVPSFDPKKPFCLDRRADVNEEFIGFDFVPVDAGTIRPQRTEIVIAKVVPYQLGAAFAETFRIATLADDCCRNTSRCNGQDMNVNSCSTLSTIFATLDPQGSFGLSVESPNPDRESTDLLGFRTFSVFDGSYMINVSSENAKSAFGAAYPLRLRGVLDAVTADGFSLTSTEFVGQVSICANCGVVNAAGNGRVPLVDDPCYYF